MDQKTKVLNELYLSGWISSSRAVERCGVWRLSECIRRLRESNFGFVEYGGERLVIITVMCPNCKSDGQHAIYVLLNEANIPDEWKQLYEVMSPKGNYSFIRVPEKAYKKKFRRPWAWQ